MYVTPILWCSSQNIIFILIVNSTPKIELFFHISYRWFVHLYTVCGIGCLRTPGHFFSFFSLLFFFFFLGSILVSHINELSTLDFWLSAKKKKMILCWELSRRCFYVSPKEREEKKKAENMHQVFHIISFIWCGDRIQQFRRTIPIYSREIFISNKENCRKNTKARMTNRKNGPKRIKLKTKKKFPPQNAKLFIFDSHSHRHTHTHRHRTDSQHFHRKIENNYRFYTRRASTECSLRSGRTFVQRTSPRVSFH